MEMAEDGDKKSYTVKSAVGFNVGDIVMFTDGEATEFAKVASSVENVLVLKNRLVQTLSTLSFFQKRPFKHVSSIWKWATKTC